MSAVSKRLTPASKQMSTIRVASATSLAPHALKNSVPPPNVPVPKLRNGTFKPDVPSWRNSIARIDASRRKMILPEVDVRFRTLVIATAHSHRIPIYPTPRNAKDCLSKRGEAKHLEP